MVKVMLCQIWAGGRLFSKKFNRKLNSLSGSRWLEVGLMGPGSPAPG